jgi:chromosome segregation ATPase
MAREVEERIMQHNTLAKEKAGALGNLIMELSVLSRQCETLDSRIIISQSSASYHEAQNYKKKIASLNS